MITINDIKHKLSGTFPTPQAEVLSSVLGELFSGIATSVDMHDLKDVVKDLAVAQTRTEERLELLAQAQTRTEERLEEVAANLVTFQTRAEERFSHLESAMENLAKAQTRTEETLHVLAGSIEQLSEAHDETRRQLGGLTATVGYTLEDAAYGALPGLLASDFGLTVRESLKRRHLIDNRGREIEMNIFGQGVKDGREITILGESKSQTSQNDIGRFVRRLERLKGQFDEVFPVFVTYMTSSGDVESYAREKGIALYYSYQFRAQAV